MYIFIILVAQSCLTLCDPMDYTVRGILQARILEWVAFPFSKRIFPNQGSNPVSHIAGRFFTSWNTREALILYREGKKKKKKSDTCSCLLLPLKREGQNVWHGQPISSVWRPLAFLPVTLSRTKGGAPVSHIAGGFFTVGATREAWNRLPCIAGPWVRGLNCKPPLHPSPYPSSPLATRSLLSV